MMTKFEPREKFNNIRYNLEDDNYCMSNLHKTFSNVTYQKSMAKPTVLLVLLLKYKVNIIARSISLMLSLTENHKNQYIKLQKQIFD